MKCIHSCVILLWASVGECHRLW